MNPHYVQWLNLIVRWLHIITGIAWIGASFYFNWLEGNLNRKNPGKKKGQEGDLWAIHGGGFYHVVKYKVAPAELPPGLHWFKWEAYLTWITGFTLLSIVYYLGADAYLIDPSVAKLTAAQAIGIGIGTLVLSWTVYDLICRSPAGGNPKAFATIMFTLVGALAWGLCQVFSSRGAYIHVGAALGTIMAANVFMVIIPNQKKAVAAMLDGKTPDPALGQKALQRSLHNNYFTLPVLFIMISNHYPITFGHKYNWLILIALSVISAGVRHYFNLKNRGDKKVWILPVASLAMIALAVVSKPPAPNQADLSAAESAPKVSFHQIEEIFKARCASCHSSNPTDKDFTIAPNGVVFDTAEQIKNKADIIKTRVVTAKTMPLINRTEMTEEERLIVGLWIDQGANTNGHQTE